MRNAFAAFELSKEWLVVLFSNKYFTFSSERMIDLLQQGLKNKRSCPASGCIWQIITTRKWRMFLVSVNTAFCVYKCKC